MEHGALSRTQSGGESAGTDSPSSLQAVGGRGSSGASSNANEWFEKSNYEIRDSRAAFANTDSPFFLRNNSSSSETPPDVRQRADEGGRDAADNMLPFRTDLLHLGPDSSSTEDFRGVIDDLTIENKKLKRRLRKYEKFHDSHLKDDKLFEVRIHGLPADKKRELEETLRKFAASLGDKKKDLFPSDGYASLMPMLKGSKTVSSSFNADSAYASMSASGQGSTALSENERNPRMLPSQNLATRRQNVQNYLHDIPENLTTRQTVANMSERDKKKIVVRRMEQIFAGKGAPIAGHQQFEQQQQEVSQSAAKMNTSTVGPVDGHTRQEGSREAYIMSRESGDQTEYHESDAQQQDAHVGPQQAEEVGTEEHDFAEQRPTRPLDLDPQRAQNPAENIRYLRQMGFSPPGVEAGASPQGDHGWIYLNFLINMAQLHTINVTDDFVRNALGEYSQKFELSTDGRRVRWKGGRTMTRNSSSGATSSMDCTGDDTPDRQSPRKRLKMSHGRLNQHVGSASQRRPSAKTPHAYTPRFFHRNDADSSDDSSADEDDNPDRSLFTSQLPAGLSVPRMTSVGVQSNAGVPDSTRKESGRKRHDGPISFYSNARFCTDLSGDQEAHRSYNAPIYTAASNTAIGGSTKRSSDYVEKRGALAHASALPEPMDLCNSHSEHLEVLSLNQTSTASVSPKSQQLVDLEVTGIGGVWPADNFAISVRRRHARIAEIQQNSATGPTSPNSLPPRFASMLRGSDSKQLTTPYTRYDVLERRFTELPPSELPAALNFMPSSGEASEEEEEDYDMDNDDNHSEASLYLGAMPPSAAPQPVDIPYASSDEDDESGYDEESDSDIDFLAGVRQVDPEAVRLREREYDANMAERLAEDIPVGSSAATAGGGSGFVSPASDVERAEYRRAMMQMRQHAVVA